MAFEVKEGANGSAAVFKTDGEGDALVVSDKGAKAAVADFLEQALACASKHLKPPEIAAIIRTQKIKSGAK